MGVVGEERILVVALAVPLPHLFDYLPLRGGASPQRGQRVLAPLGGRRLVGVVVAKKATSELPQGRLLHLEKILDDVVLLDDKLLELLDWCARYYKHAPGEILLGALPPALRQATGSLPEPPTQLRLTDAGLQRLAEGAGRAPAQFAFLKRLKKGPRPFESMSEMGPRWRATVKRLAARGWLIQESLQPAATETKPGPELTNEQQKAFAAISSAADGFYCHLLDGVTGSGKTEVYMRLLARTFDRERQALVLVPEIGLTPQLIRRFRQRLGIEPAVIHSHLSGAERLAAWENARTGRARLVLGTRSALFTPMPQLGLIILDEEHDGSFKQHDGFRHSARDVAIKRAAELNIPVVLGSATPSLESIHNAATGRYIWHRLRRRANRASLPVWRVLDMAQHAAIHGLAQTTVQSIGKALQRDEQVMVFLNRRGYAPVLMCQQCSWHAECDRCDAHLTWHRSMEKLCCHHCGRQLGVPQYCPECRADALCPAGEGTQQIEEELERHFQGASILRFDRDKTSIKGAMDRQIEQVRRGEPCIMVGTQMLAKGHHFPNVTLVVIVNVDQALYSADFRALEHLGQLAQQVAGRAGRAEKAGTVILQTMHPENQAIQLLLQQGYEAFARFMLNERQAAGLPPYGYQAMLRADAHQREQVQDFLSDALALWPPGEATACGPVPAIMERRGGRLRMYLMVQGGSRSGLHQQMDAWLGQVRSLPSARKVRWGVDIDPQEL